MSHLLLIDDSPLRPALEAGLRARGHDVTVIADGQDGLNEARARAFDCICLDLLTPTVHGFELIQLLRTNFATLRTPIVAVTDKTYHTDLRQALSLGADAVLERMGGQEPIISAVEEQLAAVRVTFWGVRGSIASPGPETARYGGNTPCVTIAHGRDTLILDAGTGIRRLGLVLQAEARQAPLSCSLLVTHTHWDHIQGFPFFVPAYGAANQVDVWGPRSLSRPLEEVLRGQMDPEYFPVALGDMAGKIVVHDIREAEFDVGPFRIRHAYMNHPSVTLGYRVTVAGRSVVYATDTEPFRRLLGQVAPAMGAAEARVLDGRLVALAENADLYIADAQYTASEYRTKAGWGHCAAEDSVSIAHEAKVRRLALFSHDPMQDDEAVDRKVSSSQSLAKQLAPESTMVVMGAREGQSVRL
ncbi:MAG: response regulator [Myxococcales bacterium]|nr:response regulator [Myxococcales bacterium]